MDPRRALQVGGGALLFLAGALFALLHVGILLIADKPADPTRYAIEVGSAWGLLLLGVAGAVLGAWLARRGMRARRAA